MNLIQDAGLLSSSYDYAYWLKRVRLCEFAHPEEEVAKLLKKLRDLESWLWGKKNQMMTNKAAGSPIG